MRISQTLHFSGPVILVAAFALLSPAKLAGQTVFSVTDPSPVSSSNATVAISTPNALFQIAGTTSNSITPLTFGTDINFLSTQAGYTNPGFSFIGTISGTPIAPGTTMPISYGFTLGKNAAIPGAVSWLLNFAGNENSTPFVVASGSLTAANAASQTFSGGIGNYSFTNGSAALGSTSTTSVFVASLYLYYTTGMAADPPLITLSMANTGFGGQGITLNAIPEPSTYAAFAGLGVLGFAAWRRRKSVSATLAA